MSDHRRGRAEDGFGRWVAVPVAPVRARHGDYRGSDSLGDRGDGTEEGSSTVSTTGATASTIGSVTATAVSIIGVAESTAVRTPEASVSTTG